jgi:hypothetical protein
MWPDQCRLATRRKKDAKERGTLSILSRTTGSNELDYDNRAVDGYSAMCRSDTAALAMASKGAEDRAAAVEVWEDTRHVAPITPWHRHRRQWPDR